MVQYSGPTLRKLLIDLELIGSTLCLTKDFWLPAWTDEVQARGAKSFENRPT